MLLMPVFLTKKGTRQWSRQALTIRALIVLVARKQLESTWITLIEE
jgi:hypothetical protein